MQLGKYLHYKGNKYEVIEIARDSETLEDVVVYRALYDSPDFGKGVLWVRKKSDFLAMVEVDGKMVPRFAFVE